MLTLLLFLFFHPWRLSYHCDSGLGDACNPVGVDFEKRFTSKAEAIYWIESHPEYAPTYLHYKKKLLPCMFTYVNPNMDYPWGWYKKIDCDTQENLDFKYCQHGCVISVSGN